MLIKCIYRFESLLQNLEQNKRTQTILYTSVDFIYEEFVVSTVDTVMHSNYNE